MKSPPVPSIQRRVLMLAMSALVAGAALLVGGSYLVLRNEMNEVFEDNLKQVALAVATNFGTYGIIRPPRLAEQLPRIYEEYGNFDFVTAAWTRGGAMQHTSNPAVTLPYRSRSGLSEVMVGADKWYLYTIVLEDGIVQAAQRDSARKALASETTSTLFLPAGLLLLVLTALLGWALRRGLAPLSTAASDVTARSVEALHPLSLTAYPPELHLLIGAINDLMMRLGRALALQRHFLADAAHELRTPMTALKLQLQLLERAGDASQRSAAIDELRAGIARAQNLVEQLLQLSRLAPDTPALQRDVVDLSALVREAVSRFSARADHLNIDLGAVTTGPVSVSGDSQQLTILLNNLVDNALRHTPEKGRVDVASSLDSGVPFLSVTDSGPGIAESEKLKVFERFYQSHKRQDTLGDQKPFEISPLSADGSGLGLAIVREVAERHGAKIELSEGPAGRGLKVSVQFPVT
jgi:signal transduction histidine kinase